MTDPLEVSISIEEEWRAVKDSNERYEVSSAGRVRNTRRQTIRTPNMNSSGYARLVFHARGQRIRKFVHRCVAEAFIPNVEGKTLVDHIDGDRTNNCVKNLRWTTQSENLLIYLPAGAAPPRRRRAHVVCVNDTHTLKCSEPEPWVCW